MRVIYKRRFLQDSDKLPKPVKQRIQEIVFLELPAAETIQHLSGLKKMQGQREFSRLRHGDDRVGLAVQDDALVVCRVLHRSEIYRYFP